jgi:DHA2 family multidrug resistance protein
MNAPNRSRDGSSGRQEQAAQISAGLRALITLAVISATLMEVLDTSIVNVALPDMMGNLGATQDQIGWVSTGYIISNVIVLPLTGWLSDYFGRKRYLTYSIILFTIASLLCGTSRTLGELVLWRIMQGSGGAAFLSTAQATLVETYPLERRGLAQGIFGVGVVVAPTIGPTLGGFITDNYTWPWIFFVNVPVGIVAATLTMLFVPNSLAARQRRSADFIGIGFLAVGLGSLQTVLERGERDNWFEAAYICVLAGTAILGIMLFLWWELRRKNRNPAVNLRVVSNRNLAIGCAYGFVLGFVLYGGTFALPQFWQNVQTHTAEQAGVLLFPGGMATGFCMPIVGLAMNRIDARLLIAAGMFLFILSMVQFSSRLSLTTPDRDFWWPLVTRGIGMGLLFVPLSLTALGTLKPRDVSDGAGLYNLFRQLGGSFGIAMLTTLIERRSHFHYNRLIADVTLGSAPVQQRLELIQGGLTAHGMAPSGSRVAAVHVLAGLVNAQAAVMSYVDVFVLMKWVGMAAIFLVLLMRRSRRSVSHMHAVH